MTRFAPPVLAPRDAASWDAQASRAGIGLATLMDAAGRGAAGVIAARLQSALSGGVIVACGTGNNGGDGWVAARALAMAGASVWVASVPGARSELCEGAARCALADGVRTIAPDGPWPAATLAVDALLGTGARGAPRADVAALLDRLREIPGPLVALDGPTGLDLETGVLHGAAHADLSITFGGPRRGHLLARDEAGDIVVLDIGLPAPSETWPRLATDDWAAEQMPVFAAADHKGTRGRIVLIGGAPGMSGAIRLAARAAFAAGAGYVHAVSSPATIAELRTAEPDVLTLDSQLDGPAAGEVLELVSRADAVVIGPGLGRAEGRREFVTSVLRSARQVVVDADALTAFQGRTERLADAVLGRAAVLTPHPGEFRTLVPDLDAAREVDPWSAAAAAADRLGATVLLKGVPTVIFAPDKSGWTVAAGNPGLGTGGSGDVLSGICGTFLAQLGDPLRAPVLSAQAMGTAGDIAARRQTARSMRPMDTIAALKDVWREWALLRGSGHAVRPPLLAELPRPAAT